MPCMRPWIEWKLVIFSYCAGVCKQATRGSGCHPHSVFPVRAYKPDHSEQQQNDNHHVQSMQPVAKARVSMPAFAQLHANPRESKTPRPGSNKRVDVKSQARHARDPGGKRDEGPNNRQEASDKNCC